MKKVTYFEMRYDEVDELISEAYGIDFEFVPCEEAGNDSQHTFSVEPKPLGEYNRSKLERKNYDFMTRSLLCDLCHQDKIDAGNYLVKVSW